MSNNVMLTKEGLDKVKEELNQLVNDVRPQVIKELVEAREQGDLSENADYDAARNRQAETEARIKELEALISKAKIITDKTTNTKASTKKEIKIGSKVKIKNLLTKKELQFTIVGPIEANPFKQKISNESPIAEAIIGKSIGDRAIVKELQKPFELEIISVE